MKKIYKIFICLVFILIAGLFSKNIKISAKQLDEEVNINSEKRSENLSNETIPLSVSPDAGDEKWYDTKESLPHSVNYEDEDLLKYLKRGDIVYEGAGSHG